MWQALERFDPGRPHSPSIPTINTESSKYLNNIYMVQIA